MSQEPKAGHRCAQQAGRTLGRMRRTSIALVRAAALTLGVAACSLAHASTSDASWSAPERVASSRVWTYSRPVLSLDGAGTGALVWHREEKLNETLNGVEAATRGQSGWAPARVLGPSKPSRAAYRPSVAMDRRGQATVVWGSISSVQAASSRASGRFGRVTTLPGRVSAPAPQVAVGPGGDATVVYPRLSAGLWVVVRRAGGGWDALPALAGTSRSSISEPQVARDARGETIIAWVSGYRSGSGELQVQAVVLGADDKPERPPQTLLSTRSRSLGDLRLAANRNGEAVLAWQQKAKSGAIAIEAAARRAGARFGRPATVTRQKDANELSVALDARGFAAILFTRVTSTQPGAPEGPGDSYPAYTQTTAVEATTRSRGGRWSKPGELASPTGSSTFEPRVACNPAGEELMAVWTDARFRSTQTATYTGKIEASAVSPGERWQPPATISPAGSFAPTLAVSANGSATAAWVNEATDVQSIEASSYKPS